MNAMTSFDDLFQITFFFPVGELAVEFFYLNKENENENEK